MHFHSLEKAKPNQNSTLSDLDIMELEHQKRFFLSYEKCFPFQMAKFLPSANGKKIRDRSEKLGFFNQFPCSHAYILKCRVI